MARWELLNLYSGLTWPLQCLIKGRARRCLDQRRGTLSGEASAVHAKRITAETPSSSTTRRQAAGWRRSPSSSPLSCIVWPSRRHRDATGRYNRYAFTFPAGAFPDYPKLGIWPDAYYATFNIFFASKFSGAMACAYDRTNMLAGNPASAVCFQEPSNVFSLLPSDVDGRRPPPAGSPNFVVGIADASDLQLFQFHVDFANPKNSSFTGPTRSRWHRSAKSAIGPSIWLASPSRLPEKRWMRSVTG